eukprot:gene17525-biopygen10260
MGRTSRNKPRAFRVHLPGKVQPVQPVRRPDGGTEQACFGIELPKAAPLDTRRPSRCRGRSRRRGWGGATPIPMMPNAGHHPKGHHPKGHHPKGHHPKGHHPINQPIAAQWPPHCCAVAAPLLRSGRPIAAQWSPHCCAVAAPLLRSGHPIAAHCGRTITALPITHCRALVTGAGRHRIGAFA